MKPEEFNAIKPADYLKLGPLDESGGLREGLSGYLSLGMAYRLKHEGVKPEVMKSLIDRLQKIGEANMPKNPDSSTVASAKVLAEIKALWTGNETGAMGELRDGVGPWLQANWWTFAAAALHLERIMKQLALVSLPNPN